MHPLKLGIWKYCVVWHSRTLWGTKLCMDLALRRTKRTESCFPWNRGENSPYDFTTQSALSFLVSQRSNPCTVWFPTWFLNVSSIHGSCWSVFRGAFGNQSFLTFCRKWAVWATGARDPRSFLSIIIVILTLILTGEHLIQLILVLKIRILSLFELKFDCVLPVIGLIHRKVNLSKGPRA